jgi:hypothetical protein
MFPFIIFAVLWGAGVGIVADQTIPEVNKFGEKLVKAGEADQNKSK